MDNVLKALSLGFMLRSLFAGVFFLISFRVASMGVASLLDFDTSNLVSVGLPVALFAGVNVYVLHRSLLYPCIEFFLDSPWARDKRKSCRMISDQSVSVHFDLWTAGHERGNHNREIVRHATVWADYTHLQYASAFSILAGLALRRVIDANLTENNWPLLCLSALIFVISAVVSDWRLHRVREKLGIHASQLAQSTTS